MPHFSFQPSDIEDMALKSIKAYKEELIKTGILKENDTGILDPITLDLTSSSSSPLTFPTEVSKNINNYDLIIAINVCHISTWETTIGIMEFSFQMLKKNSSSRLAIYGPFKLNNEFTSESNITFHNALLESNPLWGYRDINDVVKVANQNHLKLIERISMPANNFMLIFGIDE